MHALRFAANKIQPPRSRAARVQRHALDSAVAAALQAHRVVLLQAPAGFGKTSALAAQWARLPPRWAAAWVSLDEDDDAERLFACLVAALEPHDLPWRTSPDALMSLIGSDAVDGHAGLRRAAAELLNALADSDAAHGLIVLDDLHRLQDDGGRRLLDALIERLPATWTLVLASRITPPLALARQRAAGELAEFNQDDLRFSADESAALLAAEALPGAEARARELFERTAGWPAGLRLALAALRTRGGVGAAGGAVGSAGSQHLIDRHLFDYLAAEVLDDMPAGLHDFLLRCAVLPELTAARAAAVSGDCRAAEWLDEIERRGLFVSVLEAQERTLVLHDLFRNALLARLRERLPGEMVTLLQRAAASEADGLRRVGFLLRAADWPAAGSALAETAQELFLQGGAGEVLRLVEQFPVEHRDARLACVAASACCLRWQWQEMAAWYRAAQREAQAAGDTAARQLAEAGLANALYPLDRNDEAEALIAALSAQAQPLAPPARLLLLLADTAQQFRHGHHTRLPVLYGELLDILQRHGSLFDWWECVPAINWTTIAGMPALIERYIDGVMQRIGERALPLRAELHLRRALLRLWAGDTAAASAQIRAAEDDMKWLAVSGEMQIGVEMFHLVFDAVHGRGDALQQRLQRLIAREHDAPAERRTLWRHQMAVYGVRLSDTVGAGADALRDWAALIRENPIASDAAQNPRALAVRARHAAAQQRWHDANALFARLLPRLHEMDVMGQRSDLTLRAGHALLRSGRAAEAAAVIAPVLDRLRAEGVRGQALLCGPLLLQALATQRWGALLSAEQHDELRAAAALSAQLCGTAPTAAAAPADEALSAREREVLERIAAGDSNKLIARALDISPHTVKRHVANILDKLGLSSRGQAGAWLHANG
jgi:LuxR family maltose regulon positive regulatory protein